MAVNRLYYYQTAAGERPFIEWLTGLADTQARARVEARLARVASGNFGDVEAVGEGVLELRVDWGPGIPGLLLPDRQDDRSSPFDRAWKARVWWGGDKRTQQKDIKRAKDYLQDYKARSASRTPRSRR